MRTALSAVVVATFLTCSLAAAAESFENEVDFNYSRTHYSKFINQDYGLSATRYFNPIDTDTGPLGEAVFLARASSVGMNFAYNSSVSDYYSYKSTDSQYRVEAAFASKQTPVTAWIGVSRMIYSFPVQEYNSDYEGGLKPNPDTSYTQTIIWNTIHGGIGAYVADHSHVGIDYTRVISDSDSAGSTHIWKLSGKHLATISETQSLSMSADIQRSVPDVSSASTTRMLTAALEYYFTRATSVGVNFNKWTIDGWDYTRIQRTLNVTTYITPTYRAGMSLRSVDSSNARTIGFDIGARF